MSRKTFYLENIPNNWNVAFVKQLFNIGRGRVISQEELEENGKYPVYSSQTKDNGCLGYINTYDFDCDQITWTTDGANAGTIFLRAGKHNCTNVCGTLQLKEQLKEQFNLKYLKYMLEYSSQYHKRADTNGYKIMNNEMARIKIAFPKLDKQKKIANYLDKKIKKIEKIIEDNKKIIELIEEYKKEYLEKKINEISKGSKKTRLKYLGNLQNGISAGAEKFGHGKGTFINYGDVYNFDVIPNEPKGIIELSDKEIEKYSLRRGDILFTRTSETIEEVGISAVCIRNYPSSAFSGFVIRFRPFNTEIMLPDFYKYYFKLKRHRDYFAKEMNLVTRASLSQGLLGNIITVVPSMKKQNIIVNKIDKKFDNLDRTINYRKQIIEKLEEYKKSLIYEVVTGKLEVKG